ncbi:hypothetical protein Celaphus_00016891 [Cervus elaphus hippelaphus]|uniref:Mitochondria-associated granulocyte macrophage CSF-signaling molecule n=1 Tax=Cervus elaphus hippelaphus TaxID=46360 RepID=A0A212CMK6_CEREH|nr:hypothetical protein Celaphus_00016891 [Cervus elaphus hippelaphus]
MQGAGRASAQEFAVSQAAAGSWGHARHQSAAASSLPSLSLREAQQILSISKLSPKEIQKSYEHLFKVNDRSVGGSFYLQSKVVRAKERLEEELRIQVPEDRERAATQKITTWLRPSLPAHL